MCGIAGIITQPGTQPDQAALAAMSAALAHRGPDDHGLWCQNHVGLAHRRLSIIDLAGGHQPMSNSDGTVTVVFNGEIYNHRDLRSRLETQGAAFQTHCDTEVLLHLYQHYGDELVDHLDGMFAFAIYDQRQDRLLLARDRMGQKPLVYFWRDGALAFASGLAALKHAPGCPTAIREQSLHDFLSFQYVPSPHTIFTGVYKLPPGSLLTWRPGNPEPTPQTYWTPHGIAQPATSFTHCAKELRTRMENAVNRRLMSDVPLGAFLSGGQDSTIIVGLMQRLVENPVQAFTIGFENPLYDERAYARIAARHTGVDHHEAVVDAHDFAVVTDLIKHFGEPYADASMIPTFLLSQFARQSVTVALSGDGADELFGGYQRYQVMRYLHWLDIIPAVLRRAASRGLQSCLPTGHDERSFLGQLHRVVRLGDVSREQRYLHLLSRATEAGKHALYGPRMQNLPLTDSNLALTRWQGAPNTITDAPEAADTDLHTYLPNDLLAKVDVASMAVGLEVRSPFMDHRVVELATSMPWHFKQTGHQRKRILRTAFADLLPAEIATRPKMGFGVPLSTWMRGPWAAPVREILLDDTTRRAGFLDIPTVELLLQQHSTGKADHGYVLWSLLVFSLWGLQNL